MATLHAHFLQAGHQLLDSNGHQFQSVPDLRSSFASTLSNVQWQEKTGGGTRGRLWSLRMRVLHVVGRAERSESLAERKEDVLTCRRCSRERCSVETKMARRLSQHGESSSEETNLGLHCLYARLECRVDGRGQMWLTAKAHVSETLSNQTLSFRWQWTRCVHVWRKRWFRTDFCGYQCVAQAG